MNIEKLYEEMIERSKELTEELEGEKVILPEVNEDKEDDNGVFLTIDIGPLSAGIYVEKKDMKDEEFYEQLSRLIVYEANLALQNEETDDEERI